MQQALNGREAENGMDGVSDDAKEAVNQLRAAVEFVRSQLLANPKCRVIFETTGSGSVGSCARIRSRIALSAAAPSELVFAKALKSRYLRPYAS